MSLQAPRPSQCRLAQREMMLTICPVHLELSVPRHLELGRGHGLRKSSSHDPEEERPEQDPRPQPMGTFSKDTSGLCCRSRLWPPASPRSSGLRPQTQAAGRAKHLPTSVLEIPLGPGRELPPPGSHPLSCFFGELEEKQPEVGWRSLPPGKGSALLPRTGSEGWKCRSQVRRSA